MTPRSVITLVFFAFGAALGAWAGTVPQVTRAAGVDDMALGIGLTAYTIAYVLAMALGPRLARWTTNRAIICVMLPLIAVGCLMLVISPMPAWFFIALVLFGTILGLTDLFMNAEASAIEADLSRPVFASFHGSASLGVAVFAIIASFLAAIAGPWVAALLAGAMLLASAECARRFLPGRRPALLTNAFSSSASISLFPFTLLGRRLLRHLSCAGALHGRSLPRPLWRHGADAGLPRHCDSGLRRHRLVAKLFGKRPCLRLGRLRDRVCDSVHICATRTPLRANRAKGIGYISLVAGLPRALAPWLFGWLAETQSTSFAFAMSAVGMLAALMCILLIRKLAT